MKREKVVIRRPIKETLLFAVGCIVFTAMGIYFLMVDELVVQGGMVIPSALVTILGVTSIVFFGGGGILYLALMSWKPVMTICNEGITVPYGWGKNHVAWSNVKRIETFTQNVETSGGEVQEVHIGIFAYDTSNILGAGEVSKQMSSFVTGADANEVPCIMIPTLTTKGRNNILEALQKFQQKYGKQ